MKPPALMSDHELAVCLGMDALRVFLGQQTKNFTLKEIIRTLKAIEKLKGST